MLPTRFADPYVPAEKDRHGTLASWQYSKALRCRKREACTASSHPSSRLSLSSSAIRSFLFLAPILVIS